MTPSVTRVRLVATWALVIGIILVAVSGCFGGSSVSTPSTYTVSGRVTDLQGNPIPSVGLLFGSFGTATTDADGRYTKSGLSGTVKVIPKLGTLHFDPYSRTVRQASQNVDFVGMEGLITISEIYQFRGTHLYPGGSSGASDGYYGILNLERTPEHVVQMKATTSATWEDVNWESSSSSRFSWAGHPPPPECQVRLLHNGVLRYQRSIKPVVCEHITNVRLNGQPLSDTQLLDSSQPITVSWDWSPSQELELPSASCYTHLCMWVNSIERYKEYSFELPNSFTVPAYTFFPGESGKAWIYIHMSSGYADEIKYNAIVEFSFCFQMAP